MSVIRTFTLTLGTGLLLGAAQLPAAPTATMLADTCAGCHGTDGVSMGPATPNLAGISEIYFIDSMVAFKNGDRYGTVMQRIAKGYTDEEIKLMASVFAKQPVPKTNQETDPSKVALGEKLHKVNCHKCHDEDGALPDDDAGIIASQWLPYLNYSMEDYKSGRSVMPKKMKRKVDKLTDAEISALMHFYASRL
jgi:sulfide dehydrogenase cytochrome subunit